MVAPVLLLGLFLVAEGGLRLASFLLRRDDPFRLRAASGARLVYCIGDSFTWGLGVRKDRAWPQLLQELVNRASVTKRADVNNLGFPGLSGANALFAVASAIKQGDAGIILLMAGWNANDSDFIEHAKETSRPVPLREQVEDVFEHSRVYRVVKRALTYRSRTALLDRYELVPQSEMEFYDFRAYQEIAYRNLRQIVRLCREFEVPIVLLNYPYRDLPPNEYSKNEYYHVLYGRTKLSPGDYVIEDRRPDEIAIHSVIRKVGEEEGVKVIDFQEAFARSGRPADQLFISDFHHPSQIGHEIMATAVMQAIGSDLVRLADGDADRAAHPNVTGSAP
jgi:lysophospholipase L1-like esterase